eukprot:1108070-Ditylum_brightwellii.AAC.1
MAITRSKKNLYIYERLESQFDQLRQFFRMNDEYIYLQTERNITDDNIHKDKKASYETSDHKDSTDDENVNECYDGHRVAQSQETPIGSTDLLQMNGLEFNGSPEKKR